MKNLLKYLIVLIIIVFTNDVLFAQLNLVKRFEEMNKVGKSYFGRVVRSAGDFNGDRTTNFIVSNYEDIANGMVFFYSDNNSALPVELTTFTSIVNDYKETGKYKVSIDGSKLSSGVYFYSIQAGNFREVKKMILQK